jgi:MFS family permease
MLTMPFTVAVYMVRAWLAGSAAAADEGSVGRLTGLLAALYSFAQFTTSYAWGIFSTRFGRKVRQQAGQCCADRGRGC